jgi:hypothetical protein
MTRLLRQLRAEYTGAVLSSELVLLTGVVTFGLVTGLVAMRNGAVASMGTMDHNLNAVLPAYTYSGSGIGSTATGASPSAVVNGLATPQVTTNYLSGVQVTAVNRPYQAVYAAP